MLLCYAVKAKLAKYQIACPMEWDLHCISGWEEHIACEAQTILDGTKVLDTYHLWECSRQSCQHLSQFWHQSLNGLVSSKDIWMPSCKARNPTDICVILF